jgi:hypothetical protein
MGGSWFNEKSADAPDIDGTSTMELHNPAAHASPQPAHVRGRFSRTFGGVLQRRATIIASVVPTLLFSVLTMVHLDIKGHFDGLFLMKGADGWHYELKDDLYMGEGDRLLYGLDFHDPRSRLQALFDRHKPGEPYLFTEWDERDGSGYVRNILPDGKQLLTFFGRYRGDDKEYVHGLFVGGALPASVVGQYNYYMNNTGMTYFDGGKWQHVWCVVNEGIASTTADKVSSPSQWKFLGSRVEREGEAAISLSSSHEIDLDGVPLRMERVARLVAGETYFLLRIRITNTGTKPVKYYYLYGDEPWVGNYGSAAGDVGWVQDGIINRETEVDTKKYNYAGMFDYGNSEIHEGHGFSGTANFIEWLGEERPLVYFANQEGVRSTPGAPLASEERFIGLQWGPRPLQPGEERTYTLAIGMAGHDPRSGFPVKPEIRMAFNAN